MMSFDSLMMKMVTMEIDGRLAGAAVQRVTEPNRGEILLSCYHRGKQEDLLFSVEAAYARVHLTNRTDQGKKNKQHPSPFCMLLRKYLIGARILSCTNPPLERIMEIAFDPPDGLPPTRLVAEIMGRRSNLILLGSDGIILGAVRTADWDKNPMRAILPGEPYRPVPGQGKLNPLEMGESDFDSTMKEKMDGGANTERALGSAVNGLSPLMARELLFRSGWRNEGSPGTFTDLFAEIKKLFAASEKNLLKPVMIPGESLYAATELKHIKNNEVLLFESASEMLDRYHYKMIYNSRLEGLRRQLESVVLKNLAGLERKKKELRKELDESDKASMYRLYGELLLTYGNEIAPGATAAELPDLYQPDQKVTVPLDPARNAAANAKRFFNRYRKAKTGREKIKRQIALANGEIEYLESLLYSIEKGSLKSLEEIRQELIENSLLRERTKREQRSESKPEPVTFKTSGGYTILVGRNNRQNDFVTFKAAVRRDTWFHVRQVPGSHVVLKGSTYPPDDETLSEAAFLAAYFSKARDSSAADVDYTEIRHVRRRPGGKPGMVFYENFKTVTVNPRDKALIKQFGLKDN